MSTAQRRRDYKGPALFSYGFRPFFLSGAIWAAAAVPLWAWTALGGPLSVDRNWHVHEMLFGVVGAVTAGFLTTAVPNWTGRMPVIGAPLAGLWLLWVVGRIAMLAPGGVAPWAAAVDSAFLVVFAAVIAREVLAGRNWRNVPVCILTSLLALANIAFHLDARFNLGGIGERVAISAVAIMLALIGGRITPSFTRNWLKAHRVAAEPAAFGLADRAALVLTPVAMLLWVAAPDWTITGVCLVLAGASHLVRVLRWQGWAARKEPLVGILHIGYGWLAPGLALLGLSILAPEFPRSSGLHALTAGAMGVMILAVMTRATRGHTGRALEADRATIAIYAAVNLATMIRVAAPLWPSALPLLLGLGALLWALAFGGYAAAYGVMLVGRRR
ncbi:NnrS family protein [Caulobacter sp.]|uniref:NnrS family protein n=1 Tax=Caulobacter sp. TaxID=78 RepID=UPI002B48979B|nr:NnrS family protein [Caulobacter sp.]HJV40346.1 NnrS family protein [Caulobacter sp.]